MQSVGIVKVYDAASQFFVLAESELPDVQIEIMYDCFGFHRFPGRFHLQNDQHLLEAPNWKQCRSRGCQ